MGANAQTSVPTFTAGEILTAANMNISARTGIPVFADATARNAAFGGTGEKTLAEGQFAYLEDSNTTQYYDGSTWQSLVSFTASTASVATSQTTTSTTYTDLATVGPSVTVTTGTQVLVFTTSRIQNSVADQVFTDFAISGATTRSATDTTAFGMDQGAGSKLQAGTANLVTVTAGSNTFTMKYRVAAGTGTFTNRALTVVVL